MYFMLDEGRKNGAMTAGMVLVRGARRLRCHVYPEKLPLQKRRRRRASLTRGGAPPPASAGLILFIVDLKETTRYRAGFLPTAALLTCACILTAGPGAAGPLGLGVSWRTDISSRGTSQQQTTQRYYLQWSPRISSAIGLNAAIDYNRSRTSGQAAREIISPSLKLDVRNDIFLASLSGNVNSSHSAGGPDLLSRSWEAGLAGARTYRWWPALQVRTGGSRADDGAAHSSNTWRGLLAAWDYNKKLKLNYNYYQSQNTNDAGHSETVQTRHFGRLDYQDRFWHNRVMFHFSQQVNRTNSDFTARTGPGGTALVPVPVSRALAGDDATPATGTLPSAPALIDGNTATSVVSIGFGRPVNLAIMTNLQPVDTIYVYTTRDNALLTADTASLHWDLYASEDGVTWQRKITNAGTVFNKDKFRFEVNAAGVKGVYLKLVVTGWPAALDVQVTELAAYRLQGGTNGCVSNRQLTSNYKTDLGLGLNPTAATRLAYNLSWSKDDNNQGNDRDRLNQSAVFSWLYNRYFQPSVTVSSSIENNSESVGRESRSYGLTIFSRPLDTLESSLGLTRSESYEDGQRLSTSHSINWLNSATLYPGLTSNLDLYLNFNTNDKTGQAGQQLGASFRMTSRLRDNLVVNLFTDYNANNVNNAAAGAAAAASASSGTGSTSIQANYRPSDMLSFLLQGTTNYGAGGGQSSMLFNSQLAVLRTHKTQVSLGYRLNVIPAETVNGFNFRWSWNLSSYLTLNANANYLMMEKGNSWNLNARISASF